MALSLQSLDPRNFKPVTAPDPVSKFKTLAEARGMIQQEQLRGQQIQQNQGEIEAQNQAHAEAKAVMDAVVQSGGDWEKALPTIRQVAPKSARAIEKELSAISKDTAATEMAERRFREEQLKSGSEANDRRLTREANAAKLIEVDGELVDPTTHKSVFQSFKSKAPQAPDRSVTPFEAWQAQNPGKPIADWLALESKSKPSTSGGEPLVPVDDGTGVVTYVPRSQAAGARVPVSSQNKPSTGVEKRVLTFFIRAKDADENVKLMEPKIQAISTAGQVGMEWLPNMLQSELGQQYRQAQRAFTEARLRKDSGAAIPEQEYKNDARTYFAVPGDSAKTLEQKRKARGAVMEGLKQESGRAYKEHYGEDASGSHVDIDSVLDRLFPKAK